MGRRGPAPKPTALKVLQGTDRADRGAQNEAMPEPAVPEKPTWMRLRYYKVAETKDRDIIKYANEFWDKNAARMAELGLLTEIDVESFAMVCLSYGEYAHAIQKMIRQGAIVKYKDSDYINQHPYAIRADKAHDKFKKMSADFGLRPAPRTAIEVDKPQEAPSVEDILSGKSG